MNQISSNGASNSLFEHSRPNQPKQSRFDLSRITNFTYDTGMIVPFDCFPVYPGDVLDINLIQAIDTLPLVAPNLTQYKVVTHWYYMKARDLWKGFKTTSTRGRSGNITNLELPRINTTLSLTSRLTAGATRSYDSVNGVIKTDSSGDIQGNIIAQGSHSLMSFLGVPSDRQGFFTRSDTSSSTFTLNKGYLPYTFLPSNNSDLLNSVTTGLHAPSEVNALPFVMYQSIVKNNYVNQNLLQDNKSLFPDEGDDDWLLPYDASVTNFIDVAKNADLDDSTAWPSVKYSYDGIYRNDDTVTRLDQLRYAMFDDDYFTTGLPWLQRGTAPGMDIGFDINPEIYAQFGTTKLGASAFIRKAGGQEEVGIGFGVHPSSSQFSVYKYTAGFANQNDNGTDKPLVHQEINTSSYEYSSIRADLQNAVGSFTLNQFREFVAMSVWQERNARVNGSYNAMIFQHWNVNPNSEEHLPVYIGGTGDYMNFDSIIQNSASTSSSPLGTQAGYGKLPTSSSKVCQSFRTSDYGYIMGIMIIRPVTYYQQGVDRFMLPDQDFSSILYPEFQNLSPEPIYTGELYAEQTKSNNFNLLAYQERYTYAKIRQNVNRGLFQCKPEKDIMFSAMTQARWFDSRPSFSYQFNVMSPDNLRRDWLAFPSMPAFRVQTMSQVYVNRKLGYSSDPNSFGF